MSDQTRPIDYDPYLAPESFTSQNQADATDSAARCLSPLSVAIVAWAGTGIAGSIFGFGIFGFVGAAVGLFIAGAASIPVAAVIFVTLRILRPAGLTRTMSMLSAATCGCITGFGTTISMFGNDSLAYAATAGLVGAIMPTAFVGLNRFVEPSARDIEVPPAVWADLERIMEERAGSR
ncbi:MAG: hypothetical protein ACK58L_10535 [Planctomycetota bacterium]